MKASATKAGLTLQVIAGMNNAILGIDLQENMRAGCLGFSIQRTDVGAGGQAARSDVSADPLAVGSGVMPIRNYGVLISWNLKSVYCGSAPRPRLVLLGYYARPLRVVRGPRVFDRSGPGGSPAPVMIWATAPADLSPQSVWCPDLCKSIHKKRPPPVGRSGSQASRDLP